MSGVGGKCETCYQKAVTYFKNIFIEGRKRGHFWGSENGVTHWRQLEAEAISQFLNEGSETSLGRSKGMSCPVWALPAPARSSV